MNRINLWNVIVVQLYEEFRFMRDKYDFLKTKKKGTKSALELCCVRKFLLAVMISVVEGSDGNEPLHLLLQLVDH